MRRAITYATAGDPADVLAVTEVSDPPTPGSGQIQVEVTAFPIHPGDLLGVKVGPVHPAQRTVAGLEATGVVVAAGPGVVTPAVGTRVTVFPHPGSWAQRITVPAEVAVPVPDSVSDDVAAQMVCNPLTALLLYRAAQQDFSVGVDGIVVNNAANSSVARFFTTVAEHHHVATISVVRSADRARELAARHPNVPVVSTDSPDWIQRIRALADGRPIPVVLDPVGGALLGKLLSVLSSGGTLIAYGALAQEAVPLDAATFVGREVGIRGLSVGRWLDGVARERRMSDIAAVTAIAATQPENFDVAARYSLDQIADAVRHVSRPGKVGTVLVTL
ncbi:NADPH:quinone reductase-like Zn-dependent oxidoreductase [Mycobacterium sp. MAA66]|uniref:zinc-binding dehydrogenase n=1 Tax=Mycobacterium sp. MAA66 TaxID=3156297 RepID=UPI003516330C